MTLIPAWNTATARALPPVLLYNNVQRIDPARMETIQRCCWESGHPPESDGGIGFQSLRVSVKPMPHGTDGLSPRQRLFARGWHYLGYSVFFSLLYGGIRLSTGRFPDWLLFGVLVGSLLKDVYDELRLQRGGQPLGYAGIEHAPSNAVLIIFLLSGFIEPTGSVLSLPARDIAVALAVVDLLFDLSQDMRA
jgi:hypothetical protein